MAIVNCTICSLSFILIAYADWLEYTIPFIEIYMVISVEEFIFGLKVNNIVMSIECLSGQLG